MQQQRQPRLGDILDDYCPRERRVTNHAVVAMIGSDIKQTRCTTCDAEHEYKHAKIPRQRRKQDTPAALYTQVLNGGPKRVAHEPNADESENVSQAAPEESIAAKADEPAPEPKESDESEAGATKQEDDVEEGPVHRPLIRATLPRPEGQPPPTRPAPEFTIRNPGGRQNRFRHRGGHGGQQFGHRSNGGMPGGAPRQGGRPPQRTMSRLARRHGPKRQK